MPKVHVTSDIEIDFDEVLNGLARLETSDLAQLVEQVIALQARRRAPSMPKNEADLLQKINHGPAPEVRRRYEGLTAKLHTETIMPEEHQELLQLIDQIELADAERDRKSTRLNSSHSQISYAVFCLKKKKKN